MHDFVNRCLDARRSGEPWPSATALIKDLQPDAAYQLQRELVDAITSASSAEQIAGYKAALTAPAAQQAMQTDMPILGALLSTGAFDAGTIYPRSGALLETELGYTLSKDINAPQTPDTVADSIEHVLPMIEVAHPNLGAPPNGLDMIATNAAAYGYIRGNPLSFPGFDALDASGAALRHEGQTLFEGGCADVMGGQGHALCWLINNALAKGYALSRGHLLITGSVGGIAPAKPGAYCGAFDGALGAHEIVFSVSQ